MAKLYSPWHTTGARQIGANGVTFEKGTLVAIKAGFANKAVVGDAVIGIANAKKEFGADNQTVKQEYLEFHSVGDNTILEIEVAGGTLTQAKVGSVFDLNANGKIDGAKNTGTTQLKLKEMVTSTRGLFVRAK